MGLNVPKTEDSVVLRFQPVAETPIPSESGKQSSVVQQLASLSSPRKDTCEPRLDISQGCLSGRVFLHPLLFLSG